MDHQKSELLRRIVQAVIEAERFPYVIGAGPYEFWQKFTDVDRDIVQSGLIFAIRRGHLDGKSRTAKAFSGSAVTISIRRVTAKGREFAMLGESPKRQQIGFLTGRTKNPNQGVK